MKITIFGLSISSSWGNGHATLWRGLCKALAQLGHRVVFFERDVPYYANNRDAHSFDDIDLVLYASWDAIEHRAWRELATSDAAIVTSYCPDAIAAGESIFESSRPISVFYDLDTPVTLSQMRKGILVPYIGPRGLRDYEMVLSYTGGAALEQLRRYLGAKRARPLYGHVDPDLHHRAPIDSRFRSHLSYLGTYAADRQHLVDEFFIEAARARPQSSFLLGGAQYPTAIDWPNNVSFVEHVPPSAHAAFFSSSQLTLNVTRAAMAEMGWCPSGRLFEAAACGATLVSDTWEGLEEFYSPGHEILLAENRSDVLAALDMDAAEIQRIGAAARERTLDEHTCHDRARVLIHALEDARRLHKVTAIHPPASIAAHGSASELHG
ncbi:MAG TPA: glycosyltransferase [Steroidobacteraceae bacterium]|nr:glycosyltransferase [Steroidobacteraceae bacterium]